MKILGAVLELPAKQHCQFGKWAGLAMLFSYGSSKTAPRIFIFSIVLGAEYLSCVKLITIYAQTFFGYIISVFASV